MASFPFVPSKWVALTESDTSRTAANAAAPLCSAIRCESAGSAVVGFGDGSTATFTMTAGEQIAGEIYMLYTASTGTYHGAVR